MSVRTTPVDDRLHDYLVQVSVRESDLLRRLREETAAMPEHNMQISPEQGQFMAMLVRILGARRCLEVGTFTGYSSLAVMLALPGDARMTCLDVSREYTDVARRFWDDAGIGEHIDLRLGPALESLDAMHDDAGDFDFVFIDADKVNYDGYYERCLGLVRQGGIIAFDNTLWDGKVADPAEDDDDTRALRALNAKLHGDDRIELSLVPIGDGLTLCRKR